MKENKNIEQLFQEKFKHFEVSPPNFVWENIHDKLQEKKKKRKIFPFWLKASGIAASFVAVVSVLFFNSENKFQNHENSTTIGFDTKTTNSKTSFEKNTKTKSNYSTNNNTNSTETKNSSEQNVIVFSKPNNAIVSKSKTISTQNNLEASNQIKNRFALNKNKTQTEFYTKKTVFGGISSEFAFSENSKGKFENKIKTISKNNFQNSENNDTLSGNTSIVVSNSSKNTLKNFNEKNIGTTQTNSFTQTPENTISQNATNLTTVAITENPLEKILRENETKKIVEETKNENKWAINSFVSPIFFNSFANGSPLSDEFASNEKTFNNSTCFGVGVSYNITNRLTVKAGISNLNLDFDTQNIAFYSTLEDQSRIANTNIERNANSKYLAIKNEKNISKYANETSFVKLSENTGTLNQRTQYIEMPLEMSFALLNKKFGVALRGGMSTLFLTENEISIKATDGNLQIGKASNLNNIHFSSNIGLGLSYNFMKKFQLNVEPTLKYQINTYTKNSENFSPYVIGVNTGISYKF